MGFSFFKGFKIGPVRLNLSQSGVGASVGVPGLRVGQSAKGNTYLAAGRGGVRFRETLGKPESEKPEVIEERSDAAEISIDGRGEFWVDIEGEEFAQAHIAAVGSQILELGATQPIVPVTLVTVDSDDGYSQHLSVRLIEQEVGVISDPDRFGILTMRMAIMAQTALCFALVCEEEGRLGLKLSIGREHVTKEHPDYAPLPQA